MDDLVGRVSALERDEILVALLRIIASTGERDGHMGLFPLVDHERPLHLAPIRAWVFPEGIFVLSSPERPDLVGTRIVAIEGRPVDEVAALVRPLVTRDNESSLILRLPEFMITGEILHGLGLSETASEVRLTVERQGGRATRRDARHARGAGVLGSHPARVGAASARRAPDAALAAQPATGRSGSRSSRAGGSSTPCTRTRPSRRTRSRRSLLARARNPKVRRVIVDVRLNGGGDNTSYSPLLDALRARAINRPGRLVLLTGRVTFSAGGNFVAEVDAFTRARIVGEPAGGSPHNYGDSTQVELATLGWTVYVPPQYVEVLGRPDERVAVEPDVAVQIGAAEHLAGRDPVLATAISMR